MWFELIRFLIRYVLLPALSLVPATVFALRDTPVDPEANTFSASVTTFAASSSGGNTLLWMIVIGLVINALVNAKIPQVETLKAWILSKLAGWLNGIAAKIQSGVNP